MSESRINPSKPNSPSSINTPKNNAGKLTAQDRLQTPSQQDLKTKKKAADINVDITDLHEAHQEFEKGISEIEAKMNAQKKSKGTDPEAKLDKKDIGFFEKFLHDDSPVRIFCALGNEIAESFYELAEHLLPAPIAKALYGGFWSLAVLATGSRVTQNASKAKEGEALKAGAKMLVHDGISAIAFPTLVAKTANAIQNKLYEPLPLPKALKHLVKSIISILACKFTVHGLDPHAKQASMKLTGLKKDRHYEINKAFGNTHGSDEAHNKAYA